MDKRIDFAAEPEDVSRHKKPDRETRSQEQKERDPTYYQKQREQSGDSSWSGGEFGGGIWAGRSRGR
jgi:hypothetical protein